MDLRQSATYAGYLKSLGWTIEKAVGCQIFIRKIPFLPFSIIKIQRPTKIPFAKIKKLAKIYRALAIYLEPLTYQSVIDTKDYKLKKSPFLPTKTLQIDLTPSLKKIFRQMHKDARYAIKKVEKENMEILQSEDIEKLHYNWKKSINWRHLVPSLKSLQSLKKSFGKNAIFLEAVHSNKPVAGTIILMVHKTAYYYYAFTAKEGRKKLAQYLLVWEAIKLAKRLGCRIFDFEGIYDKRFPMKSWQGFSHFKKSFGGKEIEYPGCYVWSASQRRRYSQ